MGSDEATAHCHGDVHASANAPRGGDQWVGADLRVALTAAPAPRNSWYSPARHAQLERASSVSNAFESQMPPALAVTAARACCGALLAAGG
eukprot:CAMPEP_0179080018 /NCGR_PEP_ID=MMETSP0796-20121207/35938_1 /TAXON_ID=73915 /ORGANISM="Pyrodinium bahamense, Strain pbaha01" /LENGTH=90 /DNA_ID=CAMNT_0020777365 /DNA_START=101 /DNA_END=370 /DNA_ORIENTATION=-